LPRRQRPRQHDHRHGGAHAESCADHRVAPRDRRTCSKLSPDGRAHKLQRAGGIPPTPPPESALPGAPRARTRWWLRALVRRTRSQRRSVPMVAPAVGLSPTAALTLPLGRLAHLIAVTLMPFGGMGRDALPLCVPPAVTHPDAVVGLSELGGARGDAPGHQRAHDEQTERDGVLHVPPLVRTTAQPVVERA
jgi:hypothetical protein